MRSHRSYGIVLLMPLLALGGGLMAADSPAVAPPSAITTPPAAKVSTPPLVLDDPQSLPLAPLRPARPLGASPIPASSTYKADIGPRISIAAGYLPDAVNGLSITSEEDRLAAIATEDRDFFQSLDKNPNTWPESERDHRAQVVNDEYRKYLADHQNDVNALTLYGKFLRHVGERERANLAFTAAYRVDPKLAVVNQQLGNYLAENGDYAKALDYLKQAAALAPTEPLYHYQIGELLNVYYDYFIKDKIYEKSTLNQAIAGEFSRAAELNPGEPGFAWRYAECFYDMDDPDWRAALAAWDALAKRTTAPAELEVIRLQRARVFLEMGRRDEARPLLEPPVRPALEAARAQLMKILENPPAAKPASPSSPAPVTATPAKPATSS